MSTTKKCPYCDNVLHGNAQYCMYCMTSLKNKKDITPTARKSRIWLYLPVLFICLAGVFVLGISLLFDSNNAQESNTAYSGESIIDAISNDETFLPHTELDHDYEGLSNQNPIALTKPQSLTEEAHLDEKEDSNLSAIIPDRESQLCYHQYAAATCIAPMTCSICNETSGAIDSSAHKWETNTAVVHYDEVGHYEYVEVSYKKTVYLCFFCGYNQVGYATIDDLRDHISVHSACSDYNYVVSRPDLLADTKQVEDTRMERQWVVDQQAHNETVITGYTCSLCGCKKK